MYRCVFWCELTHLVGFFGCYCLTPVTLFIIHGVYVGVRTCELFFCLVPFVFLGFIVLTSLCSSFYVTGEFNRFLHRG